MKPTLELVFPNGNARKAADRAADKVHPQEPMTTHLDVWEAEYFRVAGVSPFRLVRP